MATRRCWTCCPLDAGVCWMWAVAQGTMRRWWRRESPGARSLALRTPSPSRARPSSHVGVPAVRMRTRRRPTAAPSLRRRACLARARARADPARGWRGSPVCSSRANTFSPRCPTPVMADEGRVLPGPVRVPVRGRPRRYAPENFTYPTADTYLLAQSPDLRLETKAVTGSVPSWWLRRFVLPARGAKASMTGPAPAGRICRRQVLILAAER